MGLPEGYYIQYDEDPNELLTAAHDKDIELLAHAARALRKDKERQERRAKSKAARKARRANKG